MASKWQQWMPLKIDAFRASPIEGKKKHLGIRTTAEAAHRELYVPAAQKHFGEYARFA